MRITSHKVPLLILGITALVTSRTLFALFDDPEGPNLLIVVVMAAILFAPAVLIYRYAPLTSAKRVVLGVCTQVLLAVGLFFFM